MSTTDQGLNVAIASLGTDSVSFRDYLRDDFDEYEGVISPNARWMAYTSNEFGSQEVFVRGFPQPIGKYRLSDGGYDPVWAPDGTALYFVSPPNLVKVDVATAGTSPFLQPTVLFLWPYDAAGRDNIGFDIHPDGDRFIVARRGGGGAGVGEIYLVTNWFEELKERVGN